MAFDKRKALQNALAFTQQGKWDKAIVEYQAILKADPKDLTVCNNLGDLFARAGKLGDAIEQYLKLGELYRADGLAVKAIAVYKKITKLDSARVAAYLACADLYMEQGLVGEAKIQLGTAADLYAKAGDTNELVKTYQRLAQLDAANAPLITKLADLLLKMGRKEDAAVEYDRAAQAAQAAGQAAESKRLLKKARELAPQLVGPSLGDAEALIQSGKFAEAVAGLTRLTASEPDNAEAWRLLGEAYVGVGQGAEGLAALRQAIALGIGEETLLRPLAAAMVRADQGGEAVALCERVTEDALNRGEPDDAVTFCCGLLSPDVAAIPVRTYLATLLMNLGRDDEARTASLELGAAYEAAGDAETAARVYQQLVDRNPEDAEAGSRLEAVQPGGVAAPELEGLSLSVGDDAAGVAGLAEPQASAPAEPEITLEGMDDLAALLGGQQEPPAPSLELEQRPGESLDAAGIEAVPDQAGQGLAAATIEFSLPEEETPLVLESATPAGGVEPALQLTDEPALALEVPEEPLPWDQTAADAELGGFSALLQEPSEEAVLATEPESPTADLLALAGVEEAAPPETWGEEPFGGVPVIELPPVEESIALPSDQPEPAPEAEELGALEIPSGAFLEAEPEAPPEKAPAPPGPWAGMLADLEAEPPAAPEPAADTSALEPAADTSAAEAVVPADDGSQLVAEQIAEADVYLKYGLEDKARERLVEAIRLAPAALAPRAKLKEICLERGQVAEACQQIAGIVELLVSAQREAEAVQALQQGLTLMPDHPEFRERLESLGGRSVLAASIPLVPAEVPGVAAEIPQPTDEPMPAAAEETLELEAPQGGADLEFFQMAETAEVAPQPEMPIGDTAPVAEPLEWIPVTETVDFAETLAIAEAVGSTGAVEAAVPEELPGSAGAVLSELAETVMIGLPEEAPPPTETLTQATPPAPERGGAPSTPAAAATAETVIVSVPPSPAEIPVQLQALMEGPEAGPILVVEEDRSEKDQLLADDLAEAEFYLAQGMLEEARAVYRRLQTQYPAHPAVTDLGAKLTPSVPSPRPTAAPAGRPAPAAPPPSPPPPSAPPVSLQDVIPKFTVSDGGTAAGSGLPGGGFVDLGGELAEELEAEDHPTEAKREDTLVDAVLREFQRGVREQIGDTDYETHYNLGVAYKDMELMDEAIEEFRLASRGMERALECADLLGQCYLVKGKPEEAIRYLRVGLEVPGHPREAYHGIRYTLSLAYDTQGEVERALEQLEVVQGEDPRFRDVATRVQLLRARLVKQPQPGQKAAPSPAPPPPPAKSKKKISYI